jgi:hypothetical protein
LKKACAAWLAALLAAGKARVNSLRANSPTFWIARFLAPPSRPFVQRLRRPITLLLYLYAFPARRAGGVGGSLRPYELA